MNHFAYPWMGLVGLALLFYYVKMRSFKPARVLYTDLRPIKAASTHSLLYVRRCCYLLFFLALVSLVFALARPQRGTELAPDTTKGYDIFLAIDVSGSMKALDFQPNNRLTVVKTLAAGFIQGRNTDRIGLLSFASFPYLRCPLTQDQASALMLLDSIDFSSDASTAVGTAIASAVERLKSSPSKEKIIILLTDGSSNAGTIQPQTAAQIAQSFGIKIYTIAVGSKGPVPFPFEVQNPFTGKTETQIQQVQIPTDEESLKHISQITGGMFFRATDSKALEEIYKTIDQLEKSPIPIKKQYRFDERFEFFVALALLLLVVENLITYFLFPRVNV